MVHLSDSSPVNAELTQEDIDRVHPLAAAAVLVLDERAGEAIILAEEEIAELRTGLEQLYKEPELRDAVRGLLNLGAHLHETGSPVGSKQLLDMLAEAPLLAALDALNAERHEEKSEEVAKTSEAFETFAAGQKAEKNAPKVGEQKPEGALSIDQLKFPKRL